MESSYPFGEKKSVATSPSGYAVEGLLYLRCCLIGVLGVSVALVLLGMGEKAAGMLLCVQ